MFIQNMLDEKLVENVYRLQILQILQITTASDCAAKGTRSGFSAQQEERKLSKLIGANNLRCG